MSAYEKLCDALRDAGQQLRQVQPGNATAQCPAHEDRDPSLSLRAIEGQALIHCHAGCEPRDVLAAVGLTLADLYDEPKGAVYRYDDGRMVHRSPSKQFRQSGNTSGTAQLYRATAVAAAVRDGTPVYLVEGEKDVHAVESLARSTEPEHLVGAVATTAPMGAANFHKVDVEPLRDAHVIAVVDRDKGGAKWAEQVLDQLSGVAATVELRQAKVGKDASDHIAAGHTLEELEVVDTPAEGARRKLILTPASAIEPRRVRWLWDGRLALGTLSLLAGREGVGKSTIAYWLAARVTLGELPGEHLGRPRAVLVCATEDSWEHTIVPRLIAAGANRDRVYRVEVVAETVHVGLSLPRDIGEVTRAAKQVDAALLLLDPLMSRLDSSLDSHRDHEVRLALEPLARFADDAGLAVLGLIHHNKSGSTDPLQLVMGSRAFSAVARSVHTVMPDPDDDAGTRRLFGTPKNNLGRTDLPTLAFGVDSYPVETADGTAWTGQVVWGDDSPVTITEAMRRAAGDAREEHGATAECAEWLEDWLASRGGSEESAPVKRAAKSAGHSDWALRRARARLQIVNESRATASGRVTLWSLPGTLPARGEGDRDGGRVGTPGETLMTTTTTTTPHRDGRVGREEPPAREASRPSEPVAYGWSARRRTLPECSCGQELSTHVQRERRICNPCWVAGKRSA